MFGFDWHWRAETSARGRGGCSTNYWTEALRNLHDTLSSNLLKILPLPLLIVAGGCARMSYRKTLSTRARHVEIVLASNFSIEFDLDFTPNGLTRITTYIPHPSASFFSAEKFKQFSISIREDAPLNFFLWLLGKDSIGGTSIERHPKHRRRVLCLAPLGDLHTYRAIEREVGRSLAENEYNIEFLTWARRYLKADLDAILARRESVVERIMEMIKQKLRRPGNTTQNRQNIARRWGKTYREFWDGHSVTLDKQGILRLLVSIDRPSIKLRLGLSIARKAEGPTKPLTIHFSKQGLEFQLGQRTVYQKSQEELLSLKKYGPQWVEQLERELAHKESTTLLAPPTTRLESVPLVIGSLSTPSELNGQTHQQEAAPPYQQQFTEWGHEQKSHLHPDGPASIIMDQAHNGIVINDETFNLCAESFASGNLIVASPKEMAPHVNCSHCSKSYKNYSSLLRHTQIIHEFKPAKCPYGCSETFDTYNKLNWHIRHRHKPQFSTQCRFPGCECRSTFTLWSRYSTHLRKDHKLRNAEANQYDPRDSKKRSRR
jgi:hypothetical protein